MNFSFEYSAGIFFEMFAFALSERINVNIYRYIDAALPPFLLGVAYNNKKLAKRTIFVPANSQVSINVYLIDYFNQMNTINYQFRTEFPKRKMSKRKMVFVFGDALLQNMR